MARVSGTYSRAGRSMAHALALAAVLGSLLAGCAAPAKRDNTEVVPFSADETDVHRRARIRLELAASYFQSGKPTIALDEIKQVLAIDPSNGDAHNMRGLIYMQLGDIDDAEESLRRALALKPTDANIMHNYGWLLCQEKKFDAADQQFGQALVQRHYYQQGKTLMAQGLCYAAAGRQQQAEAALLKSYEYDAGNPVVSYNLTKLLYQRGDYKRAQFYIRRLNNSELANSESLYLGIQVERALGDRMAARQLAGQLQKRFPDSKEWARYTNGGES